MFTDGATEKLDPRVRFEASVNDADTRANDRTGITVVLEEPRQRNGAHKAYRSNWKPPSSPIRKPCEAIYSLWNCWQVAAGIACPRRLYEGAGGPPPYDELCTNERHA